MCVVTWWKRVQCTHFILIENLQSIERISTCKHLRRTSSGGLFTCVRTLPASCFMLLQMCVRSASTEKACLDQNSSNTGLYKHFQSGCPAFSGDLSHLMWTLLDHDDTSLEQLDIAGHVGGAKCRCSECLRLKQQEDKWSCRLGIFYGINGLNTRDEVKSKSRGNFVGWECLELNFVSIYIFYLELRLRLFVIYLVTMPKCCIIIWI